MYSCILITLGWSLTVGLNSLHRTLKAHFLAVPLPEKNPSGGPCVSKQARNVKINIISALSMGGNEFRYLCQSHTQNACLQACNQTAALNRGGTRNRLFTLALCTCAVRPEYPAIFYGGLTQTCNISYSMNWLQTLASPELFITQQRE